jgi:hypothetical protein
MTLRFGSAILASIHTLTPPLDGVNTFCANRSVKNELATVAMKGRH